MGDEPGLGPSDVGDVEAMLLRSFREDVPSRGAKAAVLAGLGAAATTVAQTGGAFAAGAGVIKALVVGMVAGAVTVGAAAVVQRRGQPSDSSPRSQLAARPPADFNVRVEPREPSGSVTQAERDNGSPGPAEHRELQPERHEPAKGESPREVGRTAPSLAARGEGHEAVFDDALAHGNAGSAPAPAQAEPKIEKRPTSLADEVVLVDRARALLDANDAARALDVLDRYDVDVGNGTLAPEALVLRIDALLRVGSRDRASQLAAAFETAHPSSTHLSRIHSLFARGAVATRGAHLP